ncbi:MAG: type II toxin-antitoxin system death-on-curing family toxin [Thermomicrobiales bacterium]|nr:type II toxin-antitoxin system death-on-curing family toxin [Thermomicrobiales bacterium]
MDNPIYYLTTENTLGLYAELFGISDQMAEGALLNAAMLESALASPRNHALYEGADLAEQGAHLGFGLAKNHPFQDGNKRASGLAVHLFLQANGATLTCSDDYLAAWVIALTLGMSAETFAACLRSFVTPLA